MTLSSLILAASVLTSLSGLRQAEADRDFGRDFDVEATLVSVADEDRETFSVQDGPLGMTFWNHAEADLAKASPGDRVRIRGRMNPGKFYAIAADCTGLQVLARGSVPPPFRVTPRDLDGNAFLHCRIRLEAVLADALPDEVDGRRRLLILSCGDAVFYAITDAKGARRDLASLIGRRIAVIGIYSHVSGHRRQLRRAIRVASADDVTPLDAGIDPFAVPDLDGAGALPARDGLFASRRKTAGRVLTTWGGNRLLLRTDGGSVVRGELASPTLPARGDRVVLAGFPETDLYAAILTRAVWKRPPASANRTDAVRGAPLPTSAARLCHTWKGQTVYDYAFHGQDVQLDGIVRGLPALRGDEPLYLESDGQIVTVDTNGHLRPDAVRLGDTVRIRGTCVVETERMGFNGTAPRIVGLRIVVNAPADIQVLARAPWWTPRRLLAALAALLALTAGVVAWNLSLKKTVSRRTRELVREQLLHAKADLVTRERTRMSVELHDTLSQSLLAATMEVDAAASALPKGADGAGRRLALASRTLGSCRDELRQCLWDLRSRALEAPTTDSAITRALEPYVAGIDVKCRFAVPRREIPDDRLHAVLRIVRELVLNAIRHGAATSVRIAGCRQGDRLVFSVRDDGRGFDPASAPGVRQGHFGLQGIRERLRHLQGLLSVESRPGDGAKATVSIALPPPPSKGTPSCAKPPRPRPSQS